MKFGRIASLALAVAFAATVGGATLGCNREGPAEHAGKKLDKVKDKIDDAVDPKGPAEKAGRAVDRALNDNH